MEAFLDKTAKYISTEFSGSYDKLCVVLPSRRGSLFLKKYLANHITETIWAPTIYSIEDFVSELTDLRIVDRLSLTFELYEVYRKLEKEPLQTFDEFLKWGQQLLTDFNEVDLYMVDHDKLYKYLNEARALSVWNLDRTPLTEKEIEYLKFYNSLAAYYKEFKAILIKKNIASQGMAYRILAENIEDKTEYIKWKKVVFAGFNALTASEEMIIDHLKLEGLAETIWDADVFYLDNKNQEAGKFLRQHRKKKRSNEEFNWIEDNFKNSEKNIEIIGVPKNIGQVKLTGQILEELKNGNSDLSDTALV